MEDVFEAAERGATEELVALLRALDVSVDAANPRNVRRARSVMSVAQVRAAAAADGAACGGGGRALGRGGRAARAAGQRRQQGPGSATARACSLCMAAGTGCDRTGRRRCTWPHRAAGRTPREASSQRMRTSRCGMWCEHATNPRALRIRTARAHVGALQFMQTPLHGASLAGEATVARLLLAARAPVDVASGVSGARSRGPCVRGGLIAVMIRSLGIPRCTGQRVAGMRKWSTCCWRRAPTSML